MERFETYMPDHFMGKVANYIHELMNDLFIDSFCSLELNYSPVAWTINYYNTNR